MQAYVSTVASGGKRQHLPNDLHLSCDDDDESDGGASDHSPNQDERVEQGSP